VGVARGKCHAVLHGGRGDPEDESSSTMVDIGDLPGVRFTVAGAQYITTRSRRGFPLSRAGEGARG
jgi:hypothetical protein